MSKDKERPDYDKIATVDEVDDEVQKYKDLICRKVKERSQTRANKKDAMKSYNEVLKVIEEELDYSTEVIDELIRHRKLILAGVGPKQKLQSV